MNSPEVWGDTTLGKKQGDQEKRTAETLDAKERYGFEVALLEDNSIHVRDARGNEIAFEFPAGNICLDEYDQFVEQLQNKDLPLPPIENVSLAIHKPLADMSRETPATGAPNSKARYFTWEQHAQEQGISADEMRAMYQFAREFLYARYKSRLRDRTR